MQANNFRTNALLLDVIVYVVISLMLVINKHQLLQYYLHYKHAVT